MEEPQEELGRSCGGTGEEVREKILGRSWGATQPLVEILCELKLSDLLAGPGYKIKTRCIRPGTLGPARWPHLHHWCDGVSDTAPSDLLGGPQVRRPKQSSHWQSIWASCAGSDDQRMNKSLGLLAAVMHRVLGPLLLPHNEKRDLCPSLAW